MQYYRNSTSGAEMDAAYTELAALAEAKATYDKWDRAIRNIDAGENGHDEELNAFCRAGLILADIKSGIQRAKGSKTSPTQYLYDWAKKNSPFHIYRMLDEWANWCESDGIEPYEASQSQEREFFSFACCLYQLPEELLERCRDAEKNYHKAVVALRKAKQGLENNPEDSPLHASYKQDYAKANDDYASVQKTFWKLSIEAELTIEGNLNTCKVFAWAEEHCPTKVDEVMENWGKWLKDEIPESREVPCPKDPSKIPETLIGSFLKWASKKYCGAA